MLNIWFLSVLLFADITYIVALVGGSALTLNALIPPTNYIANLQLTQEAHFDVEKELIHFHFHGVDHSVPLAKPVLVAKCGIRSAGASTLAMSRLLESTFVLRGQSSSLGQANPHHTAAPNGEAEHHNCPAHSANRCLVGLLVYMWVDPRYRGLGIGDAMLRTVLRECRVRSYTHLLLAHQDTGSGRLVDYYERRGFVSISRYVEGGMVRVVD
jgi:GNAT superfamily N-acetyltransferase